MLFTEERKDDCRWLDTRLLSLNTLIEVKPDGKVRLDSCFEIYYSRTFPQDENVITVSVAEAAVDICTSSQSSVQTLISTFEHGDLVSIFVHGNRLFLIELNRSINQ